MKQLIFLSVHLPQLKLNPPTKEKSTSGLKLAFLTSNNWHQTYALVSQIHTPIPPL